MPPKRTNVLGAADCCAAAAGTPTLGRASYPPPPPLPLSLSASVSPSLRLSASPP
eukprot:CAMPEP_0183347198 /NCGR_PEP_ID=MMETSP0164_2-20130417/12097_1 /TAXON_ID=221442 /ORGANISM="Coccolithus pelagicus ssp braarudi, Strain PLY182g" /LENGTH=54 /DNA_ID=CAMNT_0025518587 /DNA_START=444 /DNA_END=605 /DNA_ORIENTATION=-